MRVIMCLQLDLRYVSTYTPSLCCGEFTGTQVPRRLLNPLLSAVGLNWDGQVSFSKLMEMKELVPAVSCFMRYDVNSRGHLTNDELKRIAKDLEDHKVANKSRRRQAAAKLMVSCCLLPFQNGYCTIYRVCVCFIYLHLFT